LVFKDGPMSLEFRCPLLIEKPLFNIRKIRLMIFGLKVCGVYRRGGSLHRRRLDWRGIAD
jgi:hypothetical protein